jgi:hypothetical protein
MKVEKFKVLLYLKKSSPDKSGKAPVMGRITINRSIVQFSCKLSCTPSLWNPRESRLNGKSREAVEINGKIEKLLVGIHSAFDSLVERRQPFDATAVKELFQGSMETQMTLLALLDRHIGEMKTRVGIDLAPGTMTPPVHKAFPVRLYQKEVQDTGCCIRTVKRTVYQGVPGLLSKGKRFSAGDYCTPLPVHTQENL